MSRRGPWPPDRLLVLCHVAVAATVVVAATGGVAAHVAAKGRWVALALLAAAGLVRQPSALGSLRGVLRVSFGVLAAAALLGAPSSRAPGLTLARLASVGLLCAAVFGGLRPLLLDAAGRRRVLAGLAGVLATVLVASALGGSTAVASTGRFRGIIANPNGLAGLCALALPGLVVCWGRRPWGGLLVALAAVTLVRTDTRAAMIASLVGVGFALAACRSAARGTRDRARDLSVALGCVAALLAVLVSTPAGLARREVRHFLRLEPGPGALGGRAEQWPAAVARIRERPWLGFGFGTEELVGREQRFVYASGAHFHNSYLGLAVQVGLPATIVFYLVLGATVAGGARRAWRRREPLEAGAVGGALAGLVLGLSESWIYSAGALITYFFWVQVALLAAAGQAVGGRTRC